MRPSPGRIVRYTLTEEDADSINRRRDDAAENESVGNTGFILHVGTQAMAGNTFPMMIVRIWDDKETTPVNGQVSLDGNDTLWVTGVTQGDREGQWHEYPRV